MVKNYFTLYHLSAEMKTTIEGGYIFEIFTRQKNELYISLLTKSKERLALVATASHAKLALYFQQESLSRRKNAVTLMKVLNDLQIQRFSISEFERILYLDLEQNYRLALQIYSSDTNFFLLKNNVIIDAFKNSNDVICEKLIEKNQTHIFSNLESLINNFSVFKANFNTVFNGNIISCLQEILPGFDRHLIKELIFRSDFKNGTEPNLEKLHVELEGLFYELISPNPRVYYENGRLARMSIIDESGLNENDSERFDSVGEAFRFYSYRLYQEENSGKERDDLIKKVEKQKDKTLRKIATINDEKSSDRSQKYEQYGKLILMNLYLLKKGLKEINIQNVFENNREEKIQLEPSKTPSENAEVYFLKAKKSKQSASLIASRIEKTRSVLAEQEKILQELLAMEKPRDFQKWHRQNLSRLGKLGLISQDEVTQDMLFRRFTISKSAELWVGKNAANNDLLTFRHARPNDIWLHARGVSGSHCVLKTAGICARQDIERAAEIAAYYSAAKSSEFVPVIYTPKKYVRKPKGALPGAVKIEREEVLLVRPRIIEE
ncbi:protein of unknown function DUF814 [Chloroherpeton thalassium ATCC 35110]|uniref:NFACT RNA-binding domain-containing protein n=1 Tax=Chloroherpeton thalassium (strain ATCC 35110 / GB-78) TaxID=517418 RepID=B3QVD4_CHLT3|nr:NFACT RNA binding domain-containing protein [Chloroherpeton thalassium]ACF14534.1 protein of unknown function DUF814 [Chloroherpeton thalassium ATCC 35110]